MITLLHFFGDDMKQFSSRFFVTSFFAFFLLSPGYLLANDTNENAQFSTLTIDEEQLSSKKASKGEEKHAVTLVEVTNTRILNAYHYILDILTKINFLTTDKPYSYKYLETDIDKFLKTYVGKAFLECDSDIREAFGWQFISIYKQRREQLKKEFIKIHDKDELAKNLSTAINNAGKGILDKDILWGLFQNYSEYLQHPAREMWRKFTRVECSFDKKLTDGIPLSISVPLSFERMKAPDNDAALSFLRKYGDAYLQLQVFVHPDWTLYMKTKSMIEADIVKTGEDIKNSFGKADDIEKSVASSREGKNATWGILNVVFKPAVSTMGTTTQTAQTHLRTVMDNRWVNLVFTITIEMHDGEKPTSDFSIFNSLINTISDTVEYGIKAKDK